MAFLERIQNSIGKKMLLWFGVPILLLFIALGIMNYIQTRDTVIPLTKELSQEVLMARAGEIGRLIQGYKADIRTMSRRPLIQSGVWEDIRQDLLSRAHQMNGDYEILFFADTAGDFITTMDIEGNISDRDYYKAIIEEGAESFTSNPMISRSTGEDIFVVACAVYNEEGEAIGLMAATILMETLSEIAAAITIGESGFGYVVDESGLLVAHPDDSLRMELNFLESSARGYKGLEAIGEAMVQGESGVLHYQRPEGSQLMTVFHPIPNTPNWSLGIALYQDELMGQATALIRNVNLLMIIVLILLLSIIFFISRQLSSPILELKEGVKAIGAGDLDRTLALKTGDEIEELAQAFNEMTGDLKTYMEDLQKTTAEKERMESELQIANTIQTSMLPRIFPPYPDIENLDLYATMEAAREVGGDFYDFFPMDKDRFCFIIGDVSGKGIPAALFMVITRTIIKNLALQDMPLPDLLYRANNLLCSENIQSMFVTLFMGILDVRTGEVEFGNAGHNPPLIARKDQGYEFLDVRPSLVLGGMEEYEYSSQTMTLKPGDMLFLYTDGVTEAMDGEGHIFSDERLIEAMNDFTEEGVQALITKVRGEIDSFVGDTPASDDVTMLALSLRFLP